MCAVTVRIVENGHIVQVEEESSLAHVPPENLPVDVTGDAPGAVPVSSVVVQTPGAQVSPSATGNLRQERDASMDNNERNHEDPLGPRDNQVVKQ